MAVNSGAQQMVKTARRGRARTGVHPGSAVPLGTRTPISCATIASRWRRWHRRRSRFSSLEGYINARVLTLALQR